jgi:hypothetical protein
MRYFSCRAVEVAKGVTVAVGVREAIGLGVAVGVCVGGSGVRVISGSAVAARSAPIGWEAANGAPHALSMIKIARLMMTRLMRAIILHH